MLSALLCYRPSVRLSVCPSVTRVDHTKTVEDRIMKFYRTVAHPSSFCGVSFIQTFYGFPGERGVKEGRVGKKSAIFWL